MEKLSKKKELILKSKCKLLQVMDEALIKTICNVKSQTIYIKIIYPVLNLIENMINYSLVIKDKLTRS